MEILIGLLIFGAVIYLLPYIIAGALILTGIFAAILAGIFVLLRKVIGR